MIISTALFIQDGWIWYLDPKGPILTGQRATADPFSAYIYFCAVNMLYLYT